MTAPRCAVFGCPNREIYARIADLALCLPHYLTVMSQGQKKR